ncbi:hypothetical protein D3C84_981870 [compost metagenome]
MQKRFEIKVRAFAHQFKFDLIRLVEGFGELELKHLKVVGEALDIEPVNEGVAGNEHSHFPLFFLGTGLCAGPRFGAVRRIAFMCRKTLGLRRATRAVPWEAATGPVGTNPSATGSDRLLLRYSGVCAYHTRGGFLVWRQWLVECPQPG